MTSDIKQARAHLDEVYGSEGSEKYLTRCASVATAHALLAMYDLLDERLPDRQRIVTLGLGNLDAIKHEAETPMREHGECCEHAPADDLPGEPVEPGDLRAGDRVAFTWSGKRITCTLVSVREGAILRSDTPDKDDYYPNVVVQGKWCSAISDVRLIERAPREDVDPDEALAKVIFNAFSGSSGREVDNTGPGWRAIARAAREHIEAEGSEQSKAWLTLIRHPVAMSVGPLAGRSYIDALLDRLTEMQNAEAERDGWRARHAALRADVDRLQREHKALPAMWDFVDALGHDAARVPQPDPDTVTLRRDDVEALLSQWEDRGYHETDEGVDPLYSRVRAALGWGDSDE